MRDNIVGDSTAAASVLGIRKRSNSYYNFGVGIRGNRALLCYSHTTTTTYIRMYVMMNSHTKSGIYIRIFSLIRNGMSELWRRLPAACRSVGSRDRFIPSLHTTYVCTSLRLITKANFLLLHDDFDCMMNQVLLLLQLHVAKLPRIFFFLFSLRLLLACFVKFFKAELCDKYLDGAVS